ncbi:sucrose phosphorylase [Microbacterium schleiferi]|uniref:Sucrose phosphorylase n=1 Tax=Microbacterium schleiferi TaxID=69362 RepID=A0A7S8MZ30_9MICO|nr:sucrose phosphorylase [Microbacterium schleiferi]QPE05358.1 sucrose phosphorylase [Microbacterium schleiferi]
MVHPIQLIAYADRLGGTIPALGSLVRQRLDGAFGGVHILPFFTPFDGADAGFDPDDHTTVDPRLGSWDDVKELSRDLDVMVDVIVNHVSARSPQFRDVIEHGEDSAYASMFLTMGSVFPDGATEAELLQIYRPRPGLPFTPYRWGDGTRLVWTTFTPAQVDIDVRSDAGAAYLVSVLDTLRDAGVRMIRLDAVGYAVKTPGTSSFMTPETFAFIDELAELAHDRGLEVLVEVHSFYRRQIEIAARVDRVYDFALPPLVLFAAATGDHGPLARWIGQRPVNAVTVLDTHDGIGIVDVGPHPDSGEPGLLDAAQLDLLVEAIHEATGGDSRAATGAAASNLDIYQVNSTFYDAMGRRDRAYLAARAVQLFLPGIHQIYYVGALAGHNDRELLAQTGVGRDINRHIYSDADLERDLHRPVVAALLQLCRFRVDAPGFDGTFRSELDEHGWLRLRWESESGWSELRARLDRGEAHLRWARAGGPEHATDDLLANPPAHA